MLILSTGEMAILGGKNSSKPIVLAAAAIGILN